MKRTTITIEGTHCHACKLLIEDICKDIKGITSCHVDPANGQTIIEHGDYFDLNLLRKEIESSGQYKIQN
jgi:copper chaperone CopZ